MACWACGSTHLYSFYSVEGIPTSSVSLVLDRVEASTWPVGRIDLDICTACGFIQNSSFGPSDIDYTKPYEDSQAESPTFRAFVARTAEALDSRFGLRGRTLLEVGCGKGEWMAQVCRQLEMQGLGIDPAFVPGRVPTSDAERFEVLIDFFDERHRQLTGDLIACRHTLEHIHNPRQFASLLCESMRRTPGAGAYIEVPDAERILTDAAFWDVFYEHCSYFTRASLARMMDELGFRSIETFTDYGDQYLLATASGEGQRLPTSSSDRMVGLAERFGDRCRSSIAKWQDEVDGALAADGDVVVWGASSKAVAFLAAINRKVTAAVDINPARQGSYLPGTATPIIGPQQLKDRPPGLVIVMNPIYRAEIEAEITSLGLSAHVAFLETI